VRITIHGAARHEGSCFARLVARRLLMFPLCIMKIDDFDAQLVLLLTDGAAAEELLGRADGQFARRTFIRSAIAVTEGVVWVIKKACLQVAGSEESPRLSVAECAILADQTYELKNSGEVQTRPKHLRLADNVRFTFQICSRFFGADLNVDPKSAEWNDFHGAVKIRNRIMHPKDLASFDISDKEMEICTRAVHWFNMRVQLFRDRLLAWGDGELCLTTEAKKG